MRQSLLFLALSLCWLMTVKASDRIDIWEGTDSHHSVELIPFIVSGNGNCAVIVCPGGSYFWHDMETEGYSVARWLNSNGISAFVLKYRTAGIPAFLFRHRLVFHGNRYPDAHDDLLQSLRLVRKRADEYGIDKNRVGAMGFSAGGHLVMSAAELFDASDRPAFVVSVYPVVTLIEDCCHRRSRRALLGDSRKNNRYLRDLLSLERHVPDDCPPVFLVNCIDDPVVDYRNSVLLDSALTASNIEHEYVQYVTGGHGFGASDTKGTVESRQWRRRFLNWIDRLYKNKN